MTVTVAFDASPGVQQWVVNKKTGRGFLNMAVDEQRTASTQSAAISAARRIAEPGERIVFQERNGGRKVIRSSQ